MSAPSSKAAAAAVARRRRDLHLAIAQGFAVAPHLGNSDENDAKEVSASAAPLDDRTVSALTVCLEEFVHVLASELATVATTKRDVAIRESKALQSTKTKPKDDRSVTTCQDVVKALTHMEFGDIATEASDYILSKRQQSSNSGPKRSLKPSHTTEDSHTTAKAKKRKKAEFTQEQIDAQELLLAASKKRMDESRER
jgi:hypothetical protein